MNIVSTLRPTVLVLSLVCAAMGTAHAGLREGLEAYQARDYARGYRDIEIAAEAGSPDAQGALGSYYALGLGRPVDRDKALHWLTLAAEGNDLYGLVNLAIAYYHDDYGVKQDCAKARALLQRAAEQNSVTAYQNLALSYKADFCGSPDTAEAIKWASKAAEMGDAKNAYFVGLQYWQAKGVTRNHDEAYKWFLSAATQGNPPAMVSLGMMNLGDGRPKDLVSAMVWLRLAQKTAYGDQYERDHLNALVRQWSEDLTPAQTQEVDRRVAEFVPQHTLEDRYEQRYQKRIAEATRWDLLHPDK